MTHPQTARKIHFFSPCGAPVTHKKLSKAVKLCAFLCRDSKILTLWSLVPGLLATISHHFKFGASDRIKCCAKKSCCSELALIITESLPYVVGI